MRVPRSSQPRAQREKERGESEWEKEKEMKRREGGGRDEERKRDRGSKIDLMLNCSEGGQRQQSRLMIR